MLGMYHALIEARIPFELVHEAFLTPEQKPKFEEFVQKIDEKRKQQGMAGK